MAGQPRAIARFLITQRSGITAVLFSYLDNQFYVLALEALGLVYHELGIDVSNDLPVIGIDGIPLAALPEFDLTSLRWPVGNMARNSVRLIIELIQDRSETSRLMLLLQS